jgi:hypothetical protein
MRARGPGTFRTNLIRRVSLSSAPSRHRIDAGDGAYWPCSGEDHPDTLRLFRHRFAAADGRTRFARTDDRDSAEPPNKVIDQAEIATYTMFKTRPDLLPIWPDLVRHASLNMSCQDGLGFLGRQLQPRLAEVITDAQRRPEGGRVRHRVAANWVKIYDKASVLRVETVIKNTREFPISGSSATSGTGASGGGAT